MIVSKIVLKNWRNFRYVEVPLKNRMFLVGPNASGKSNFLDVFRFLRDIAKPGGGLQKAVQTRGGISKIRCLAARRYSDVEIEVELSNFSEFNKPSIWKYAIGIKQQQRGLHQPYLAYEKVWHKGELLIERPDDLDKKDELRLSQTFLEQISANEGFREVYKFFNAIQYFHLVPQLIRNSESFTGPEIPGDPFGRNFLERVARTSEATRRSRLLKIESALRLAVPQLNSLKDTKDEVGIPHLEAVYTHWRPLGARQNEDQFSDGTLRLIGLLWSLLEDDALLLLEEPELSLHAAIVSRLPALMYRLQRLRKRQILLSTHSADLLSDRGIGGEEALLFITGTEGTDIQLAKNLKDVRGLLEGGLSLADAVLPKVTPLNIYQLELFE